MTKESLKVFDVMSGRVMLRQFGVWAERLQPHPNITTRHVLVGIKNDPRRVCVT